jgi:sarcosine oxidase delta subunit
VERWARRLGCRHHFCTRCLKLEVQDVIDRRFKTGVPTTAEVQAAGLKLRCPTCEVRPPVDELSHAHRVRQQPSDHELHTRWMTHVPSRAPAGGAPAASRCDVAAALAQCHRGR